MGGGGGARVRGYAVESVELGPQTHGKKEEPIFTGCPWASHRYPGMSIYTCTDSSLHVGPRVPKVSDLPEKHLYPLSHLTVPNRCKYLKT